MNTNSSVKGRVPYFDFLRGLAILMVVGIHTYPGNHQLDRGMGDILQLVLINLFNCAVPLFLAISGYFIANKSLLSYQECGEFWKKQIPTVYIPCLIFSIPWLVLSCASLTTVWPGMLSKILYYFTCGYSVYYFIALIIECYLLAPILVKHNNEVTLILVLAISIVTRIFFEYVRYNLGIELPYIIRGSFPPLLIFFYIGVYLRKHSREYSLWIPIGMILIGLILGIWQMQCIRDNFGLSGQGQKMALYLFDIGFILLCMSKRCEKAYRANWINRIVLYIGEISFGVYFTHVYLIYLISKYLSTPPPILQLDSIMVNKPHQYYLDNLAYETYCTIFFKKIFGV